MDMQGAAPTAWIEQALKIFEIKQVDDAPDTRQGQFTENRIFLRRIAAEWDKRTLTLPDMRLLERAFERAVARHPEDVLLDVEKVYLRLYDRKHRRKPAAAQRLSA